MGALPLGRTSTSAVGQGLQHDATPDTRHRIHSQGNRNCRIDLGHRAGARKYPYSEPPGCLESDVGPHGPGCTGEEGAQMRFRCLSFVGLLLLWPIVIQRQQQGSSVRYCEDCRCLLPRQENALSPYLVGAKDVCSRGELKLRQVGSLGGRSLGPGFGASRRARCLPSSLHAF